MPRQLRPDNFETRFDEWERAFEPGPKSPYLDEALRLRHREQLRTIRLLTERAHEQDVNELVRWLGVWKLGSDEMTIGYEFLQGVAMEALCYLGSRKPQIKAQLEQIAASDAPEWREVPEELQMGGGKRPNPPPLHLYNMFQRNLRLVLKLIDEPEQVDEGVARRLWARFFRGR